MRGYELLELWKAEHLFLQQIDALECQDRLRVWLCQYQATGTVSDLPRVGHPRVTTRQRDCYITLTQLQNRFQPPTATAGTNPRLRGIGSHTTHNRLHEQGPCAGCPAVRPAVQHHHCDARLAWPDSTSSSGMSSWPDTVLR